MELSYTFLVKLPYCKLPLIILLFPVSEFEVLFTLLVFCGVINNGITSPPTFIVVLMLWLLEFELKVAVALNVAPIIGTLDPLTSLYPLSINFIVSLSPLTEKLKPGVFPI